ncbi:hypothetical protein [Aureliella helgolandensis]|uniref:Uncharacterized protein n=1 Tax=Aureliella helgolandensis TaxID=2527968 RepID=A0A518G3P0_9BACT|nr:hypothetical protein [Aureliella helgolandensis]QDV23213.1 hypothetical protein Q31a_15110 [Aureliella helgolandensis]
MRIPLRSLLTLSLMLLGFTSAHAQTNERIIARLFWQDASDQSLKTGDLKRDQAWSLKTAKVDGFPILEPDKQMHVQMQQANGIVLTGIHDTEEGKFQSGWVAIESGVVQEAHGNHFHWKYTAQPNLLVTRLDDQQGNPAHVYLYDGMFYLANDKKNGFTVVSPAQLRINQGTGADHFVCAGGGHITLAAVSGQVAYSTWIDRDGDNVGRVDVVGLGSHANRRYQFQLPSGGIHGAMHCSGKVFFAPSDGICWVEADISLSKQATAVVVNHVSLGDDTDGTPRRTGAFVTSANHVLFNTGRGSAAELCMLDASSSKPVLGTVGLSVAEGNSATTPTVVQSRTGEPFALLFEESHSGELPEKMHVIALDPNRDGNYSDANLRSSIVVGRSLIEGHSGHHEATAIGRAYVAITNPGSGTIAILSTSDWTVQTTLQVGGTPTRIIAVGG